MNYDSFASRVPLPRLAQEAALKSRNGRRALSRNPYLDADIFRALLDNHPSEGAVNFIEDNLTYQRALEVISHPEFARRIREENDQFRYPELAATLLHPIESRSTLSNRAKNILMEARSPRFANWLLLQPSLTLEEKKRIVPDAYRAVRVFWLGTLEADVISDAEAMKMVRLPDTEEPIFNQSGFHWNVQRDQLVDLAFLYLIRPGLRTMAASWKDASSLQALSLVELSPLEQSIYLDTVFEALDDPDFDLRHFLTYSARSSYSKDTPGVINLVSAPWCTKETLERVLANSSIGLERGGDKISYAEPGYSWSRRTLLDLEETPRADLETASPEVVSSWLEAYGLSPQLQGFLAASVLERRDLGRKTALIRGRELKFFPRLAHRLRQRGKRTPLPAEEWSLAWDFNRDFEPKTKVFDPNYARSVSFLSFRAAAMALDGGVAFFEAENLTLGEWEFIFSMMNEFEGTLREFAAAAKTLSA